jgi:hypothetical protein
MLRPMTPAISEALAAYGGVGSILWFDPRRGHSSVPTANPPAAARRAGQGWPPLRRPPEGLGLDRPEHGGKLDRIGAAEALSGRMDGARAEAIRHPRDRLKGQPQERSLITGPASTAFWLPDGPERAPALGRRRSRSKIGYWCKSSR